MATAAIMTPTHPSRRIAACLALGAALGLGGCRERNVTAYRIPKEADAPEAAQAPEESAEPPQMRFMAPAGWQSQPASGMREASFLVAGPGGSTADVSVVSFPGSGGDDLANINRWRGQLKLPPVAAADLPGQTSSLVAAAGEFVIADMAGTGERGEARILGAWLRRVDRVWFFKVMGPSALVEGQKDAFTAFLKSVSLGPGPAVLAQQGPGPENTNDLPRSPPAAPAQAPAATQAPMDSVPVRAANGASLRWSAPADWQPKPGSAMRKGSYSADGAEVAITAFPGDVGGVLANVNRWRGQAGLDPVDEAGLAGATSSFDSNGLHFVVLDASNGPQPLVAAAVPWGGGTWFFKLTGPAAAMAKAKPAFLSFLRTVRAPQ